MLDCTARRKDLSRVFFSGVEALPFDAAPKAPAPAGGTSTGGTRAPSSVESGWVDPFVSWLLEKSNLDVGVFRSAVLQRRLPACLRQLRVGSGAEARVLIERRPEMRERALSTLLIGVTSFFRDPCVFESLRQTTVPALLKTRSGLRVCSLGVSHGQEMYSMAMLLADAGVLEHSSLLGVDCREDAIAHAAAGFFEEREWSGLEEPWKCRYTIVDEFGRRCIRPELRDRICWQAGNLFSIVREEPWDMILFRNVAIYFDADANARLWVQLAAQLVSGGFLVTGQAEQPPASAGLRRVMPCIYQRVS